VPPFAKVLAKRTNAATDKTGKLKVVRNLTIPGHPDIFVIGDLATGADGKPFQAWPRSRCSKERMRER